MPSCNVTSSYEGLPICCAGGKGTLLGGGSPFPGVDEAPVPLLAVIYLVLLLWCFSGVGMAADAFMTAIETITSQERTLVHRDVQGVERRFRARVWNATIANLSLMALGSSAPEILLSLIELLSNDYYSGELGPSTIVGSAAFNMLVIIAVCVVAIPANDARRIAAPKVYAVTALSSTFAYAWLVLILSMHTPNIIDLPEATLTFLFFPLLLATAYLADKWDDQAWRAAHPLLGAICCWSSSAAPSSAPLPMEVLLTLKGPDGAPASREDILRVLKQLKKETAARDALTTASDDQVLATLMSQLKSSQLPKSRAAYRVHATRVISGGKPVAAVRSAIERVGSWRKRGTSLLEVVPSDTADVELQPAIDTKCGPPTVGFESDAYSVVEGKGKVTLTVTLSAPSDAPVTVAYKTEDLTATAGADYVARAEELTISAGETTGKVTIVIIDDDEIEDDEMFLVRLGAVTSGNAVVGRDRCIVTIVNDDFPGTIAFPNEEMRVLESAKSVAVRIDRTKGCSGEVTVEYKTKDGSARAGINYGSTAGQLSWGHLDVTPRYIEVPIIDDEVLNGTQFLELEIFGATNGALFDASTDGATDRSIARISIEDDERMTSLADHFIGFFRLHSNGTRLGAASWKAQFVNALTVGGADDDDEPKEASSDMKDESPSACAYVTHWLLLPWKLLVACVPPTSFAGGWLCFVVAIVVIGGVTALIGDLANLLGCTIGLEASVVAITLVALGTSLPDTFASKAAALGDDTADAAIGNVTGSNSVNVFLGLGLSWLVGAFYWSSKTASPEWLERYPDIARSYNLALGDTLPGLAVKAGSLNFSVSVFIMCSICCLGTLTLRRTCIGAELGSQYRWPTACFFVFLWFLYVLLSSLKAYEFI